MNEILKVELSTNNVIRDLNTETQTKENENGTLENVEKAFTIKKPKLLNINMFY